MAIKHKQAVYRGFDGNSSELRKLDYTNLVYVFMQEAGTLIKAKLQIRQPKSSSGGAYFQIRKNGTGIFTGDLGNYMILGGGQDSVEKTGLEVDFVEGDMFTLDLVAGSTTRIWLPLSLQLKYTTPEEVTDEVLVTTASLADAATEDGEVTLGKTFILKKVVASDPCRVRLYSTAAARTADSARAFDDLSTIEGTEHGIICDLKLNSELEWDMSPVAVGANLDDPAVDEVYYAIQNNSGGTTPIDVTFTTVPQEV